MKNYINYINERFENYTKLATSIIDADNDKDWEIKTKKLIDFDIDYDYDLKKDGWDNILTINFNVTDFLKMLGLDDVPEYVFSILSDWTAYDTPDDDDDDLKLEHNLGYFDDESDEYMKKILNLFDIKTKNDDDFREKTIIFFELFEKDETIANELENLIYDIRGMISSTIQDKANEIDSKINFEYSYNRTNYNKKEKYDFDIKINLENLEDEKTIKEFVLKSKDAIEEVDEDFRYDYTITDEKFKKTNKSFREYELKRIFDYCEFQEEDIIAKNIILNDEIIEEISKIGGLIEKFIKDYDTQKEYITYYDDLDDIEIDSEAEKIKRITNLRKQNIILPKIEKEFGYIADLDKFNI